MFVTNLSLGSALEGKSQVVENCCLAVEPELTIVVAVAVV